MSDSGGIRKACRGWIETGVWPGQMPMVYTADGLVYDAETVKGTLEALWEEGVRPLDPESEVYKAKNKEGLKRLMRCILEALSGDRSEEVDADA